MSFNGYSWKGDEKGKFHERLAFYVLKKNKRLEEISKATGISIGSISGYCSGKHVPTIDKVIDLCNYLKISITKLTGVTGRKKK